MFQTRLSTFDVVAAASVPFLAVWAYEISNAIVLIQQGFNVSISTAGLIPLGVAGISAGEVSPFTKVLQIVVAMGLLLPFGAIFSKERLQFAEALVISSVGIYLMSGYWEMLSVLSAIPMAVHVGIYITGTGALTLVLLRGLSRPLRLWSGRAVESTSLGALTLHQGKFELIRLSKTPHKKVQN